MLYLVITNISKLNNVKSLLKTASAFGCNGVFMVGKSKFNETEDVPLILRQHISSGKMPLIRFQKWDDFTNYLEDEGIILIGVEIQEKSVNIDTQPVSADRKVAFLMGNEGQGIHPKHMASCKSYVKISQYGSGTASLNVNVAASIVLHRYHLKLHGEASPT
mmetsp:Transcript_19663/g.29176  ORF Transcript_19663/g.29176 Transcript_19663/m.29176 type:complete len:162 (-) Transcript_19663:414-899(-)|eukprot:CAMPEP_0194236966 /NCGR_PEP_ID=MMETSP0158-20130606/4110_1 /TAXON_ID=33649 /ORGANISM="Thalassionema nitzschioides, Strain L26-B" /LENGTH=161 /DNA_ID=CAMNT_0038970873 /DNA_START=18 /DNA_END=503 /DNA_ORIENTATION=+